MSEDSGEARVSGNRPERPWMDSPFIRKVRHIVPVYLLVLAGTVLFTLLFRWLLVIELEVLALEEEVFDLWLPVMLPWLPILIWLRPQLNVLVFGSGQDVFLLQFLAWLTMVPIMMGCNAWLETATGGFISLDGIEDMGGKKARFVSIDDVRLERRYAGAHVAVRASGRYNESLTFECYQAYPFETDRPGSRFGYWYGVKSVGRVSNRLSDEEKDRHYAAFVEKCARGLESHDYSGARHYEVLPHSQERQNFLRAVSRAGLKAEDPVVVVVEAMPDSRNQSRWIIAMAATGFLLFLAGLAWAKFDPERLRRWKGGVREKRALHFLKYLIPRGRYFVTAVVVDLNILIFALMIISGVHPIHPDVADLRNWGGNSRSAILAGEYWRLLTSTFVHGGAMHLLMNVYGLTVAALLIEPLFGRLRYLVLYVSAGVLGSIASVLWHENAVSVGASGAIFGLYGALCALAATGALPVEQRKHTLLLVGPYVVLSLLYGVAPGIDSAAHVGGLVSGAIVGLLLYRQQAARQK